MRLTIKDPDVVRLVKVFARQEGVGETEAVRRAVARQLVQRKHRDTKLRRLKTIAESIADFPVLDDRPVDELLGYGPFGDWS